MKFTRITIFVCVLLIFFLSLNSSFAQSKNQNFDYYGVIQDSLVKNIENHFKARFFADMYLKMAEQDKDTTEIKRGLYFLSQVHIENDSSFFYSKKVLDISKKTSDTRFTSLALLEIANYYYRKRKFKKALDYYVLTKKHTSNTPDLDVLIDYNIGLLKKRIGDYDEALPMFKKYWAYVNVNNFEKSRSQNYLDALFALSCSYVYLKKTDSASFYNQLGVQKSIVAKKEEVLYGFVLNEGVNKYYKRNYATAIDSITKAIPYLNKDIPNTIVGYFYLGKIYAELGKPLKAIQNFEKVDSLFQISLDIIPKARESYEYRLGYYKKNNDDRNQLKVNTSLIRVDSVLNENYRYLIKNIIKKYDTPMLLQEKEVLIDALKKDNKGFSMTIIGVIFLLLIALTGFFFYYNKQRIYKKRFEALLYDNQITVSKNTAKKKELDVSEDIRSHILNQLDKFERKKKFLSPTLTSTKLSADFDTNPKYLSQIINFYKEKNFTKYINDLRVEEAVNRINSENKFRNYTIKAIAYESGFNTAESFSKAFYAKVKLYPSFYIKNMKSSTEKGWSK